MASVFLASQEEEIGLRRKVKSHAMCERTRTSKKKKKKKKKKTTTMMTSEEEDKNENNNEEEERRIRTRTTQTYSES